MSDQRCWIWGYVWLVGDDPRAGGRDVTVVEGVGNTRVVASGPPVPSAILNHLTTRDVAASVHEAIGDWMRRPGILRVETIGARKLAELGDDAGLLLEAFGLSAGRGLETLSLRFNARDDEWEVVSTATDSVLAKLAPDHPFEEILGDLERWRGKLAAQLGAAEAMIARVEPSMRRRMG